MNENKGLMLVTRGLQYGVHINMCIAFVLLDNNTCVVKLYSIFFYFYCVIILYVQTNHTRIFRGFHVLHFHINLCLFFPRETLSKRGIYSIGICFPIQPCTQTVYTRVDFFLLTYICRVDYQVIKI